MPKRKRPDELRGPLPAVEPTNHIVSRLPWGVVSNPSLWKPEVWGRSIIPLQLPEVMAFSRTS